MGTIVNMNRRREIRRTTHNILSDIEDYWGAFQRPVAFRDLSRRYSKHCTKFEVTFRTLIKILEKKNLVTVELFENLRRNIWPAHAWREHIGIPPSGITTSKPDEGA